MASVFATQYERLNVLHSQVIDTLSTIYSIGERDVTFHSLTDFQSRIVNLSQVHCTFKDTIYAYHEIGSQLRSQIINMIDYHGRVEESILWHQKIFSTSASHDSLFKTAKAFVMGIVSKDLKKILEIEPSSQSLLARIPSQFTPISHSITPSNVDPTTNPSSFSNTSPNCSTELPTSPSPQENITTSGSVDDVSISSIPIPNDSVPVKQTDEIIPSQSVNPVEPSTTVPIKDPFINSVSSSSNHNIPNQHTTTVYPNHSLDPILIQGTTPKKKQSDHSSTSKLPYPFHFIPWREGSRPLSITHSTAQSIDSIVDSIAATKHPPLPSHFTPLFILYSDSSVSF
ncbi:hypothetical protein PRIPAC_96707 [Pristionchus pacificus]|uniref:Uncharacterized protein n=1 Tax=Pristionchus pacificus TaxID=54126 RepID=A0A2A6BK65_PRIPA|nr:hypothetical protein PRIPAC_96707 [Pristionchus pacificus]|eukprot:PDM66223.1 hypothetical protein PRIPAC_45448 [Pristionchus pacificus]